VARTVINYYFRSKDTLFKTVFEEAMQETAMTLDKVLLSPLPFREKVIKFIDVFLRELTRYPYKESFMISEINANGFVAPEKGASPALVHFFKELETAMDKGEIKKMLPINFMLNLFSLTAYPLLVRPLFKELFNINDVKFRELMTERKKVIIEMLFT